MIFSSNSMSGEKKTIAVMIKIFCQAKHRAGRGQLCSKCQQLLQYAQLRIDKCPYGATKGPCSKCKTHCYKPLMQGEIIDVMRFAGPKMLKSHPILAANHLLKKWKKKK